MRLFEFICDDCQEKFELLLKTDEVGACPNCESEKIKKTLNWQGGYYIKGDNPSSTRKRGKR